MSVLFSDQRYYGSVDMPEADSALTGGAIDFTKRVEFADIAASGYFDAVSSSASDTATLITWKGRDPTGVIQTQAALTLTGTTKVTSSTLTLERLLAGVITGGTIAGIANPGGTAPVGDVALMARALTISGHTMQAGSTNAASNTNGQAPTAVATAKLQSGDGASVAVGQILRTTGGTGPFQIRRIIAINPGSAGADVVGLDRNWTTIPDATTTYEVAYGFHFELAGSSSGVALTGTTTQVLAVTRLFSTLAAQASGGSTVTAYEKVFLNNNNLLYALTGAEIEFLSETPALPSGALLDLGLSAGLNDTATIANRQTAPASVTFTTQPAYIPVPSPGNLPASASAGSAAGAQALWARLTLPAGSAAYKGSVDVRSQGTTT